MQNDSLWPDEVGAVMAIIGRELRAEYGPAPGPNAALLGAIRHIKEVAAADGRPTVEDAWRSHELLVELATAGEAEA